MRRVPDVLKWSIMDAIESTVGNEESDVRIEEQLRVKIGEAKNILPRNGSGLRDLYCTINLDQEEIHRTSIAEKTLNPFYGEEFQFEIPRRFRNLAFYVIDRERSVNFKDKILGKVAVKRDELTTYHGKDHWFPITPVDADSEVQGKIHVEVKVHECMKPNGNPVQKLAVRVIECNDIGVVNGACDPYVAVTLCQGTVRVETKRTKIKKKTTSPLFNEIFHLDMPIRGQTSDKNSINLRNGSVSGFDLRLSVMHDSSGMFGNVFLGEIKIPLGDIDLKNGHNAWYLLRPREVINKNDEPKIELGSLRLKIQYTSDYVLASRYYEPLRRMLIDSAEIKPVTSSAVYVLGEVVSNKNDAAQPLVKLFVHYKKIIPLVKVLAEWEMSKVTDPNTIFRGNTLLSKCLEELMKLIGTRYLHETLRNLITQVFNEKKQCEIDPTRLKDVQVLGENMANLRGYLDLAFKSIMNSVLMCPHILCEAFSVLKELALQYFPDQREICYSVISGFVFLRFFAPAILNPKLYDITDQPIDPVVNRTLTLISKTIQTLGNLVSSKCNNQVYKEDYMATIHQEFITDHHIENTRVFLELISSSNNICLSRISELPVLLKEGVMIKRSQEPRSRISFAFRRFKKRYFCLTTREFYYAKAKHKEPICKISIQDILAVEKLQEESFKMKYMFQIVQKDRALYIQASNCVEEKEWIDILTKICQTNKNRLHEYHPSAYIGCQWLCCKASNEAAPGCCPVSCTNLPADIGVHIDPDREVARVNSLFLTRIQYLNEIENLSQPMVLPKSGETKTINCNFLDDKNTLRDTLNQLKAVITQLEHDHKQYMRRVCVKTIYGSEKAPIGDNDYLLMLAEHCPS